VLLQKESTSVGVDSLREVILTINANLPPLTVINIQTGAGGGPATVAGDPTIELPATGAEFAAAGIIVVLLNGQSLDRGPGLGLGTAQWVSSTQLAFSKKLKTGEQVRVVSPLPAP
jgi:hypothetical protein